VLQDGSGRRTPEGWANEALRLHALHKADRIVAEVNNGGDMIEAVLRHKGKGQLFKYRGVRASRGKRTRAEPIAALYEQGKVSHVGRFDALEEQLTTWDASDGSPSPDRLDALVWALTDLMKPTQPDAYGRARKRAGQLPRRRI
jgi:predicted phage terminase large subunit-like protein